MISNQSLTKAVLNYKASSAVVGGVPCSDDGEAELIDVLGEVVHLDDRANSANLLICPELLRAPIPKAEPYPVESLGVILGAAATALHETIKAPLALCCQSVLASASLAAQAHFDVMLPWGKKTPLSLFLLTVAESGERKSGVDDVVLSAAKAQERQDMEAYNDKQKVYESDFAQWCVFRFKAATNSRRMQPPIPF